MRTKDRPPSTEGSTATHSLGVPPASDGGVSGVIDIPVVSQKSLQAQHKVDGAEARVVTFEGEPSRPSPSSLADRICQNLRALSCCANYLSLGY